MASASPGPKTATSSITERTRSRAPEAPPDVTTSSPPRTSTGTGLVSRTPTGWRGCCGAAPGRVDAALRLARRVVPRQVELRGLVLGDGGGDLAGVPHAVSNQRWRRVVAEVAGLRPEVVEVGRVGHPQALEQDGERVHAHGPVAEPGPRREAHPGHLEERAPLLVVEPGGGIAAPADLHGVDDLVEAVAQHPLRVHADREHVRDGHRRPDDVRDHAVPDAGGVLGAADRPVAAAAPAVRVPVGAVLAVHRRRRPRGSSPRRRRSPGRRRSSGRRRTPGCPRDRRRSSRRSRRRWRSRTRCGPPRPSPSGRGARCRGRA